MYLIKRKIKCNKIVIDILLIIESIEYSYYGICKYLWIVFRMF